MQLSWISETVCHLDGALQLETDAELVQTQILSDVKDVHTEFIRLWGPRWQKHADLREADWTRLMDFARSYLPTGRMELGPITLHQWRQQLRRFKPRAARGPDGWARQDLLNMPRPQTLALLAFLDSVELGGCSWPAQMVVGFVISLVKPNGREDAQGYRPICLFSIIYRAWAGLRARQLMRHLSTVADPDILGFLPGRSAVDMWFAMQCEIELSLQNHGSLSGYCSDIIKAFNNLPRLPILQLAEQLGCHPRIVRPWTCFLADVRRHFKVRDTLSEGLLSSSTFPEGDPLSPAAMVVANIVYQTYVRAFTPQVRPLCYADNYAGLADSGLAVLQGLAASEACCEMLDLQMDPAKTYVWSTDPLQRRVLRASQFQTVDHARELGGMFAFRNGTRNAALVDRCAQLQPTWQALARARSPLQLKLRTLPVKFWAFALHGAVGCAVSDATLNRLRSSAVRALALNPAGSNALLRLSICLDMQADPGFYHVWSSFRDFRRMLTASNDLALAWKVFCLRHDGALFQGPFSQLMRHMHRLGWTLCVPPLFKDHEGLTHNFLHMPLTLLKRLAQHAWLQWVSSQVRHREHMRLLHGIEPALLHLDAHRHTPLDAARQAALQSGAFIFPAQHAKFDSSQSGLCPVCQVVDDHRHRVCDCPKFASARLGFPGVAEVWDSLPSSFTHHLLAPADPALAQLRGALHELPDTSGSFWSVCDSQERQHLFTDGTCTQVEAKELRLAAWGVVNATSGHIVGTGYVPGILQSTPRAEIYGVIAALQWVVRQQCLATLWLDAKSVASVLSNLLQGEDQLPTTRNLDLWQMIIALVSQLECGQVTVQHVPSHLDPGTCRNPFKDWAVSWNQHVDVVAAITNLSRPVSFLQVYHTAASSYNLQASRLRALHEVYFCIASATSHHHSTHGEEESITEAVLPETLEAQDRLSDMCPVGWRGFLPSTGDVPRTFLVQVGEFLLEQDLNAQSVFRVSFLELLFMVLLEGIQFPVACPDTGRWIEREGIVLTEGRATAAVQLRLLRKAMRILLRCFDAEACWVGNLDVSGLGATMPFDGLRIGCSDGAILKGHQSLMDFAAARPIRASRDLARPILL